MEPSPTFQPSVLSAAWRFRWLVMATALLGAVAAVGYLLSRPVRYQAAATAVFENPSESLLSPVAGAQVSDRFIGTQMQILQSGTVAVRAAEIAGESGVDLSPATILGGAQVTNLRNTDVVTISFRGATREAALAGAEALLAAYTEVRQERAVAEADAILERLDGAARVIDEDLADVAARMATASVGETTMGQLDQQLGQLTDTIIRAQEALAFATAQDEVDDLNEQIADAREQLLALQLVIQLTSQQPEVAALLRERQALQERRTDLAERRNQVEIEVETVGSGFEFVSSASLISTGTPGAGRLFTAAGGLLLGGLLGVGVAYYFGQMRRSFTGRHEPELVLGKPLLAEVPNFAEEGLQTNLPVRDAPRSASAEAFRFAASNLDIQLEDPDHRLVTVVSALVGEGKSALVANLALAAARSGRRVLVVDADFGNQQLSQLLLGAMGDHPGLTEVVDSRLPLRQGIVAVQAGGSNQIHLLSRGMRPVVAPDFFRGTEAQALFASLSSTYELVVIDTPPLLQVAYASMLVRFADLVVVAVPHGSQVRLVEDVAERLRFLGAAIAGYVYNRAPLRRDLVGSEGSMKDVLGDRGLSTLPVRRAEP